MVTDIRTKRRDYNEKLTKLEEENNVLKNLFERLKKANKGVKIETIEMMNRLIYV